LLVLSVTSDKWSDTGKTLTIYDWLRKLRLWKTLTTYQIWRKVSRT
jgi:hypothetical protein